MGGNIHAASLVPIWSEVEFRKQSRRPDQRFHRTRLSRLAGTRCVMGVENLKQMVTVPEDASDAIRLLAGLVRLAA